MRKLYHKIKNVIIEINWFFNLLSLYLGKLIYENENPDKL